MCLEEVEVAHFAGGTLSAEDFKKGFFFGGRPCGKVWDEGGEHGEVVKGSCGGVDRVRLEGCSRIWRGDTEDLRESPGRGVAEVLEVAAEVAGHQAGGTEAKVSGGEAIPGAGLGAGEFVEHVTGGKAAEGGCGSAVFGVAGNALLLALNEAEEVGVPGAEAEFAVEP